MVTACCGVPIAVDQRFCPKCGYEARVRDLRWEICICAAWKTEEGPIIRGHRHPHCRDSALSMGLHPIGNMSAQGFITSTGRFVDRKEGARLQREACAWNARTGLRFQGECLMSEDLY